MFNNLLIIFCILFRDQISQLKFLLVSHNESASENFEILHFGVLNVTNS